MAGKEILISNTTKLQFYMYIKCYFSAADGVSNYLRQTQMAFGCSWLGLRDKVQTFDDLEGVKDKQSDIISIRQIIDGEDADDGENLSSSQFIKVWLTFLA